MGFHINQKLIMTTGEHMIELLAFGTFWFWLLVAAELVALFSCAKAERGWLATFSLLGFGAALQFISKIDILGFLWVHPIGVAGFVGAYLMLGLVWGAVKWRNLYRLNTDEYEDKKRNSCILAILLQAQRLRIGRPI